MSDLDTLPELARAAALLAELGFVVPSPAVPVALITPPVPTARTARAVRLTPELAFASLAAFGSGVNWHNTPAPALPPLPPPVGLLTWAEYLGRVDWRTPPPPVTPPVPEPKLTPPTEPYRVADVLAGIAWE